jgi:hypothetical protein
MKKFYTFILHLIVIILVFIVWILTIPHETINGESSITIIALAKRITILVFLIPGYYITRNALALIRNTLDTNLLKKYFLKLFLKLITLFLIYNFIDGIIQWVLSIP